MAQFYKSIITNKGLNLIAKTQTGARIQYTRIVTGDGQWSQDTNFSHVTNPKNQKQSIGISSIEIINSTTIRARGVLSNEGLSEGYYIREIGLFALDPDEGEILYCIVTAITSDFFPAGNNSPSSILIDILTTVSNTDSVMVTVNPSAVATAEDLQELREKIEIDFETILGTIEANRYVHPLTHPASMISEEVNKRFMTDTERTKLANIQEGANKYIHPGSGTNPHGTTKSDVGLGSVENYGIATAEEAIAGIVNNKYITPLRLMEAIGAYDAYVTGSYVGTNEENRIISLPFKPSMVLIIQNRSNNNNDGKIGVIIGDEIVVGPYSTFYRKAPSTGFIVGLYLGTQQIELNKSGFPYSYIAFK